MPLPSPQVSTEVPTAWEIDLPLGPVPLFDSDLASFFPQLHVAEHRFHSPGGILDNAAARVDSATFLCSRAYEVLLQAKDRLVDASQDFWNLRRVYDRARKALEDFCVRYEIRPPEEELFPPKLSRDREEQSLPLLGEERVVVLCLCCVNFAFCHGFLVSAPGPLALSPWDLHCKRIRCRHPAQFSRPLAGLLRPAADV